MSDDTLSPLNNVITIDDEQVKSHLDRVVRGTVEETNALLSLPPPARSRHLRPKPSRMGSATATLVRGH